MILKASLFRLSNFAYETATKKKLNLFINTIIFISIFAISAASLSLFYENKIDEIDRKIILAESQKILLENQISVVPNSLNSINLIEDAQLKDQSNIDISDTKKCIFCSLLSVNHSCRYFDSRKS